MATKEIATYAVQDPASGDKALGVDSSNETKLLNLGSAASRDVGSGASDIPDNTLAAALAAPSGMLAPFAMTTAPAGWLLCDGSEVSRATYSDLFTAIGTVWGGGDGSTTFNLPDLRGAFLRGAGAHGTETDAGGTAFTGPAVGSYQDDQMQRITGQITAALNAAGSVSSGALSMPNFITNRYGGGSGGNEGDQFFNSADSPDARTSATTGGETRPFGAGVYYCIKT